MLKNYVIVAIRNLRKHIFYSLITVTGLAIGIACCLFIFLFVQNELNYDRFHANGDRIYRLLREASDKRDGRGTPATSGPYAPSIQNDYPNEIRQTVRVLASDGLVTYENKSFMERKFFFADSTFFRVFSFPLQKGDPATVLNDPNSIVITQEMATKYFGDEDPIGKILTYESDWYFTVTGVLDEVPGNSHLDFDMLASISVLKNQAWFNEWMNNSMFTYVLLDEKASAKQLEAQLPQFIEKYIGEQSRQYNMRTDLLLQPLKSIYFDNLTQYDAALHGDIKVVYIFGIIALFTLLIACINFMNLATARSMGRAKEVGLRKVLGALRRNLIMQFLSESVVLTFFAVLLSLGIVLLGLPYFNAVIEKELSLPYYGILPLFLISIILGIGLLAGSYPAFFLSSFQPVKVLKGKLIGTHRGALLRQGLVVLQFSISVILIIGTFIIIQQMNFLQEKKLGYDKDQVLLLRVNNNDIYRNRESFKNHVLQNANVREVSAMSGEPGGFHDNYTIEVSDNKEEVWRFRTVFTDYSYVEALGLKVIAGRDFDRSYGTDATQAAIVNETAVRKLRWTPEEALGKEVFNPMRDSIARRIVGVVEDFHISSLKNEIEPMLISIAPDHRVIAIKIAPDNVQSTVQFIEEAWNIASPRHPFEYTFLDEVYNNLYKTEQKQRTIFSVFSTMAIFIACLGLFGLAAFTAEQRTREIGIRKVLGASIPQIVRLLYRDFLKPVLVAILIAAPIAWYAMTKWLDDFAYRIAISPWLFILASGLAVLVAVLTVSFQSIKAALANPVESLRNE